MPPKKSTHVKFSDKLTDSLEDISRMIKEHKDMIDVVQDVALDLTSAMGSIHTLSVKYAGKANQILDILLPIVKGVPLFPKKLITLLSELEKWTQNIIDKNKSTSKTIADVNSGLRTGDVSKLKAHSKDIKKITKTFTSLIPKK